MTLKRVKNLRRRVGFVIRIGIGKLIGKNRRN
jgi:hypothetical protein